jgi:hypothetical protein
LRASSHPEVLRGLARTALRIGKRKTKEFPLRHSPYSSISDTDKATEAQEEGRTSASFLSVFLQHIDIALAKDGACTSSIS